MAKPPVSNALKDIRLRREMTQERLAELAHLSRQSVISIELGRFLPTIETALRLAQALGVGVEDLFWLSEKRK